ncbi:hypothetical protein [Urbifossiella limnaea]|uniref:Uncharacterized protein n=1 Tax=Urbifossiella limnaea TaxID=2528023 RepID=A0A517XWJ4_9BACT|nr:hypothetical protein [Urbifossiella limnaea]QDU21867.1 hypothetical protein ETAA1_38400 [Urbifossiella limnaea]
MRCKPIPLIPLGHLQALYDYEAEEARVLALDLRESGLHFRSEPVRVLVQQTARFGFHHMKVGEELGTGEVLQVVPPRLLATQPENLRRRV